MFKRIISVGLIGSGVLLVIAALILAAYNLIDDNRAQNAVDEVMDVIEASRDQKTDETSPTAYIPPNYILDPSMDMPTVEIYDHQYIGTLTIPSLALELPVMDTWSYPQLKISPCRYTGSVYENNMIILAHNYTAHFGRLRNLELGDAVIFTDMDGNEFYYAVSAVEILEPTAIEEMESGDWDLSLFTCTLGGQARVTVRCYATENH